MSEGLQRRRGVKSSNDSSEALDVNNKENNRVAFDPQDLSSNSREVQSPMLTLMEEVLLIGLKDREGYLSFWNDNISYALRGLILLELAFRGKIQMVNDPARRRFELPDRLIEVVDGSLTGEMLLDEALKLMKSDPTNSSVLNWIDLLSGETWNLMKINYQLKQVRERLAKGLVDKGVLRTERKNFFLFDMATHPISDPQAKRQVVKRMLNMLTNRNYIIENDPKYFAKECGYQHLRSVALVCGCYAGNVLENVVFDLNYEQRDRAFNRADELLSQYSDYPFENKKNTLGIGINLHDEIEAELDRDGRNEMMLEVIAAVINVFSKMDSIL
ncbi:PtdIns4P sensor [Komagataella phaffii]|nr:GQ67_03123T0 [Komagataella phaffii]AOA69015.1 GQ68_03107T0 [Komagataella phaffii GS115]CAH2450235.1 PtdIns4P sensor [Komagataella phaffii CBS 7435]